MNSFEFLIVVVCLGFILISLLCMLGGIYFNGWCPQEWHKSYWCMSCKKEVSEYKVWHNKGICPHCGIENISNSSIVDVSIRVRRWHKFRWEYK